MAPRQNKREWDLTLDGKIVDAKAIQDAVLKHLRTVGQAKPREIAAMLGPEWVADYHHKHYIAGVMGNLRGQGYVESLKHGLYIIHPNFEQRKSRRFEDQVVMTIRDLGGIARARDILEDFDARPAANRDIRPNAGGRGGTAGRIFKMLRESKRIAYYDLPKRPRWGLPWPEMAQEPLTGNAAAYFIEMGFIAAVERGAMTSGKRLDATLQEAIKDHFTFVGMAFKRAREMFNVERTDLLQVVEVYDCLEHMRVTHSSLMSRIYKDIKDDTERRAAEESRADDTPYIERLRDAENEIIHAHILAFFEAGDPAAHMIAPPNFYRVFAHNFHLDAAALSRGTILPIPHNTDLADDWWSGDAAIAEFGERVIPHDGRRANAPEPDDE